MTKLSESDYWWAYECDCGDTIAVEDVKEHIDSHANDEDWIPVAKLTRTPNTEAMGDDND